MRVQGLQLELCNSSASSLRFSFNELAPYFSLPVSSLFIGDCDAVVTFHL